MKIAFVADLHANLRLPMAKVDPDGCSSDRLRDVVAILGQIREHADALVIVGDLFDRAHPDGPTLIAISRALKELSGEIEVFILPGNHDAISHDGRLYNLQFYGELDVPGLTILGHDTYELADGVFLHAAPWLPDDRATKRIRYRAAGLPKSAYNILALHQGVAGALWDSGHPAPEGVPQSIGEGFDLTIAGHFHRPQRFASGHYVGAPLDLRFGDEDTARGFDVFDTDTTTLSRIDTVYPTFATRRIVVPSGGKVDPTSLFEGGYTDGHDYVRMILEGEAIDLARVEPDLLDWATFVQAQGGARAVTLDPRPTQRQKTRVDVDPSLSLRDMIVRYVAEYGGAFDRREIEEIGLKLVEGL